MTPSDSAGIVSLLLEALLSLSFDTEDGGMAMQFRISNKSCFEKERRTSRSRDTGVSGAAVLKTLNFRWEISYFLGITIFAWQKFGVFRIQILHFFQKVGCLCPDIIGDLLLLLIIILKTLIIPLQLLMLGSESSKIAVQLLVTPLIWWQLFFKFSNASKLWLGNLKKRYKKSFTQLVKLKIP